MTSHKKLIAVTISTPRGPGNKNPPEPRGVENKRDPCSPVSLPPPLQEPTPLRSLQPGVTWQSLKAFPQCKCQRLEEARFQGLAGDLVLHLPSPSCCWGTDTSPSRATDPEPGLVPRPWGADEDHRAHRHQEWQPAADAEGLPHRPGTTALRSWLRGGGRTETDITVGVSQALRPQLLLAKPCPAGPSLAEEDECPDAEFGALIVNGCVYPSCR